MIDFVPIDIGYLNFKFSSTLVEQTRNYDFDEVDRCLFADWLDGFSMETFSKKPSKSIALIHENHRVAAIYAIRLAMSLIRRRRRIHHIDLSVLSDDSLKQRDRDIPDVYFLASPNKWSSSLSIPVGSFLRGKASMCRFVMTASDANILNGFLKEEFNGYGYLPSDFVFVDLVKKKVMERKK